MKAETWRALAGALRALANALDGEALAAQAEEGPPPGREKWEDRVQRLEAETKAFERKLVQRKGTPQPHDNLAETLCSGEKAAERLGISQRTLEKYRVTGGGPPFIKIGKSIRYRIGDLDSWIAKHEFPNTSAYPQK
jgi:hypothetical protein